MCALGELKAIAVNAQLKKVLRDGALSAVS